MAVRLHDLTVAYRGHPAVHHVSGSFQAGRLAAVVGPNGAGKSSLLAAVGSNNRSFQGRIERDANLRLAYLAQARELDRAFPIRVREFVAMGLWAEIGAFGAMRATQRQCVDQALAAAGLGGFDGRLLGELSAGQVQRVLFARVLRQR